LDECPKEFYMKNVSKLFGLIALIAIIGFSMAACNDDDDPDGGNDPFEGTWTNVDMGMTIVAADGSFTVSQGDNPAFRGTYTVSGNNVAITFTQINTGSGWTAFPENGGQDLPPKNITGTISGNQIIIEGMIFTRQGGGFGGGNTPGGGNAPGGGNNGGNQTPNSMFVLTGIPNNFNKKYAMFYAENNYGDPIIGADSINASGMSGTLVEIQNGKVSLPMWVMYDGNFTRYHGGDTVNGSIMIFSFKNVSNGTEPIEERFFTVTFSDGAATKTWSQGQIENPNSGGAGGGGNPNPPDDGGGAGGKS
jgi:hypothetical protein